MRNKVELVGMAKTNNWTGVLYKVDGHEFITSGAKEFIYTEGRKSKTKLIKYDNEQAKDIINRFINGFSYVPVWLDDLREQIAGM